MTDIASEAPEAPTSQRNAKGQWVAGRSGNPRGRPRKKLEKHKSLGEHAYDALNEKVAVVDANGRRRMVARNEALIRDLLEALPTMKPRDSWAACPPKTICPRANR